MDWCKLIQSIESTLDIRDSLVVLKNRAEALAAADNAVIERTGGHQAFLSRLIGDWVDTENCVGHWRTPRGPVKNPCIIIPVFHLFIRL